MKKNLRWIFNVKPSFLNILKTEGKAWFAIWDAILFPMADIQPAAQKDVKIFYTHKYNQKNARQISVTTQSLQLDPTGHGSLSDILSISGPKFVSC